MAPPPPRVREVVAGGGPNAQDHPDLFRLVGKHQQQQQQQQQQQHDVSDPLKKHGCSGVTNKAATGETGSAALASAGETRSENRCATGTITPEQLPRGAGLLVGEASAADGFMAEREDSPSSGRRQERAERVLVAAEEEDPAEPAIPPEKCPW